MMVLFRLGRKKPSVVMLLWCLLFGLLVSHAQAWEWSDMVSGSSLYQQNPSVRRTLSIDEVSSLRVRELKRLLALNHGYSAEEMAKMIDKKELIHALAFEEEKERLKNEATAQQIVVTQGIIVALLVTALIFFWPLLERAFEVVWVNVVVYTDRKRYEVAKCMEFHSYLAMVGIALMFVLDALQAWLTGSVCLSWFVHSKYFFPIPSFSVSPVRLMGGEIAKTSLANYGINIAPMLITGLLRFIYARIEQWTGRTLSNAQRRCRQEARNNETPEERAARKAAKKFAKQERAAAAAAAAVAHENGFVHQYQEGWTEEQVHHSLQRPAVSMPPDQLPTDWMEPSNGEPSASPPPSTPFAAINNDRRTHFVESNAHKEFLQQLHAYSSELDELD